MSLSDFELICKLGDGSYSSVYKVTRIIDSAIYALKQVPLGKLKPKEQQNALNEVRLLASITHPSIIAYKEAFIAVNPSRLCLITEYADAGDLYQRIQRHQRLRCGMPEAFIWSTFVQVMQGLKVLHDLKILHRDIKSANVFLFHSGVAKLGDMNVSKVAKQGLLYTQTGTPYYASPEVWQDRPHNSKSDIWSLGCVLYEAICLRPPFKANDMKSLHQKVTRGKYNSIPSSYSKELASLVNQLLQVDQTKRPSCEEILELPSVQRHMREQLEATEDILLKSIQFSDDFTQLAAVLPKPKYVVATEPPSLKISRAPSVKEFHAESRTPAPRSSKLIMREEYGALQLPKLRYPSHSPLKNAPRPARVGIFHSKSTKAGRCLSKQPRYSYKAPYAVRNL